MHWGSRFVLAGLVASSVAPALRAQARPPATPSGSTPSFTILGGIASGDKGYNVGLALGGTAKWVPVGWPVAIRGDAYFAHHGSSGDVSLNLFGVGANAEYT